MKLIKGDEVQIIRGKDKGKKGKIEKVFSKVEKVLIPEINIFKRHKKGMQKDKSEIINISKPVKMSNVALICPNCHKLTRVGYKIEGEEKLRICRKCDKTL